eukprot:5073117-Ditylum_brightwellii.AAC.1
MFIDIELQRDKSDAAGIKNEGLNAISAVLSRLTSLTLNYGQNEEQGCEDILMVFKGTGSTKPAKPHEDRWVDRHCNVHSCYVDCPVADSTYFDYCEIIDGHKQQRQFELALEKH